MLVLISCCRRASPTDSGIAGACVEGARRLNAGIAQPKRERVMPLRSLAWIFPSVPSPHLSSTVGCCGRAGCLHRRAGRKLSATCGTLTQAEPVAHRSAHLMHRRESRDGKMHAMHLLRLLPAKPHHLGMPPSRAERARDLR